MFPTLSSKPYIRVWRHREFRLYESGMSLYSVTGWIQRVGVGWLEEEFRAVNVPWPQRGRRTDEYLDVLATLWNDETSSYEGEFYSLNPCQMFPKPVQAPVPIHIGGESDAALRRAFEGRFGRTVEA